jgi:hypothetical protein
MSASDAPRPELDALLERLRQTVEERRRSGEYPPGLERELDEHYRRIAAAHARGQEGLPRLLRKLEEASEFGVHRIPMVSDAPAGAVVHKAVGRLVVRQTEGVLNQVQEFALAATAALRALADAQAAGGAGDPGSALADLSARVDGLLDRLAALDRGAQDAPAWLADLVDRVDRLEAEVAGLHAGGDAKASSTS